MKHSTAKILVATIALGLVSFASAEETANTAATANAAATSKVADPRAEYMELSSSKLQRELNRASEAFYKEFNALNEIAEYDVRCSLVRPTGSRIKNHVCKAKFIKTAESRHAERNWDNRLATANQDVETGMQEKIRQFEEHMSALIAANPSLQEKLNHYNMMITLVAERSHAKGS